MHTNQNSSKATSHVGGGRGPIGLGSRQSSSLKNRPAVGQGGPKASVAQANARKKGASTSMGAAGSKRRGVLNAE